MKLFKSRTTWVFSIIAIAAILVAASINFPKIKYGMRVANIKLFQSVEIAGASVFMLPATYHRQEHSLSCEIAALKMALSVFNINVSESELISKLSFDTTPKGNGTWGDPNKGFVGNINGKMMVDGYGVYWTPINEVANNYVKGEVMQFDPQHLAYQLKEGHPVVAWGFSGAGKRASWQTPDNQTIEAIDGEHARAIVGFNGSVDNPTGFILFDPIYGKLYWRTKDLMNNWAPYDNIGVVLSPQT